MYHPLLFHMLDVAAVAKLLWQECLPGQLLKRLASGLQRTDAPSLVMFTAGAHDLGKASPAFQNKIPELAQHTGLPFSINDRNWPHGFISTYTLQEAGCSGVALSLMARIAGGHHGVFPRATDLQMGRDTLGSKAWTEARRALLQEFSAAIGFELDSARRPDCEIEDPAIVPILGGFFSVVDWIGSNQDFFPCAAKPGKPVQITAREYWGSAQAKAREALEALGWLPAVTFAAEAPFDSIFSGFIPNSLQQTVIELASEQQSPYLMIIEAPMGEGKTEAALYAADLAMCRGFARGMYIAMPTQATGNAMFRRVLHGYLKERGHKGRLNLQLVHGDALLAQVKLTPEGEISAFDPVAIEEGQGDVEAQSWFTAKKRPLLAPFGVGTIDQSLLSVLKTRHWFLRLFGLAGKVVIFDEVHAYDAYISTILERLLRWLAEADCTVLLLSATLPETKRKALAKAYSGRDDVPYKRYPRITLAKPNHFPDQQSNQGPRCTEVPHGDSRTVHFGVQGTDLKSLLTMLSHKLKHGGCAAVICNTVDRSIETYMHLRENLQDTECSLFHARTLRVWRREREEEVLRKFGKTGLMEKDAEGRLTNDDRPHRAVLVATQVIEQSLDLDFDLMVSEIAPVDLLLQRAGRLHRHHRERPDGLETPLFIVLCDAGTSGPPPDSFGDNIEHVYDRHVLLRTWLALRGRDKIELPPEIESLVETVYDPKDSLVEEGWHEAISDAKKKLEHERSESEKSAGRLLVCQPKSPADLIEEFNDQLGDDEDPKVHRSVRAATREGDPSITVVLLPKDRVLKNNPDVAEVRDLLDRSARLSHRGVFEALLKRSPPKEWARNVHLRHARLLRLDGQNRAHVADYLLTVDEATGIRIERDGV